MGTAGSGLFGDHSGGETQVARVIMSRRARECGPCVLILGALTIGVVVVLVSRRAADDPTALAVATGAAVGCALVLAASLANLARVVMELDELWTVVVLLTALGAKAVVTTALAPGVSPSTAGLLADACVLGAALAAVVLGRLLRIEPPPLILGGMLGLGTASPFLLAPLSQVSWVPPLEAALTVLVATGYTATALLVAGHWPWGRTSRLTITAALLVLGAGQALEPHAPRADWLGVLSGIDHLVAALLLAVTLYVAVHSNFSSERRRLVVMHEQVLEAEEAVRQAHHERHELLNLVAGISLASELLVDEDEVDEPVRRRLEHSIHDEAMQVRALLESDESNGRPAPHGPERPEPTVSQPARP